MARYIDKTVAKHTKRKLTRAPKRPLNFIVELSKKSLKEWFKREVQKIPFGTFLA
jgi:hypothetical protein